MKLDDRTALRVALYVLFTLSGAAGLIYESLWARYLGLFVGHTAYAQIIVLGIFLGGMAGGALLVGARSRRLADPLVWYARAELVIGVLGIAFHAVYGVVTDAAYNVVFPAVGVGWLQLLLKWGLAALLILPQSIILGATFPLLTAGVLRRFAGQPGRTLAILYFANSFGAAAGVLLAGFWLIALAGLPGTLLVAGALNLFVAAGTLAIAARYPAAAGPLPEPAESAARIASLPALRRLMLAVAFGTAVASFIYEIGWIRMLSLVLGSATHSFESMLSAFILGLALGSLWARKRIDRWRDPVRALGIVQWLMGLAALATLPLYTLSFDWMAALMRIFARTDAGYLGFSLARYGLSLAIMLPATFCAGIVLPLIIRALVVRGAGERAIGDAYGLNTLGSIVGVAIAGLILLPAIGLKSLLIVGAGLDMALGALILAIPTDGRRLARPITIGVAVTTLALLAVAITAPEFDQRLLASSVYREGTVPPPGSIESVFHRDGRTATITVHRRVGTPLLLISTNGKPDASLPDYWMEPCREDGPLRPLDTDAATQALAPLITLAHVADAQRAAVIGVGSGMSSHFLLGVPAIGELVTIEIEPAMTRGARAFYPANRRIFDDPRSRIVYDDAKSFFASDPREFDYIFSEPSNPWVSGVASLFSTEFYARMSGHLAPRGVFGQWLHLYEIDDTLVLSVLAAIHANFRSYVIYQTWNADVVIVASNDERLPEPDWSVFRLPEVARDFCHTIPVTDGMLEAARLLDRAAVAPLVEQAGHANSDFFPVLDLGAERTRYRRTSAAGLIGFAGSRFDFIAPFFGRTLAPSTQSLAPVPGVPRMQAQAVSAAMRSAGDPVNPRVAPDAAVQRARYRRARWQATLTGTPPDDWRTWLSDFAEAERATHGAARGVADERFYGRVHGFLATVGAPAIVRHVVAFRHGLASWDFRQAAAAGDELLGSVVEREGYLPPAEFLDGMVTAKLRVGDAAGAARVFSLLAGQSGRRPDDLRLALLLAYIRAALDGNP